jgi:hypothetical protein
LWLFINNSEKDELVKIARGIVLVQGNTFIKELLRKNNIRIGATKTDFEAALIDAIENGQLQRHQIEEWLNEVEGWGDQHVYLFQVPREISQDSVWSAADKVQARLKAVGLGDLWQAETSLEFPSVGKLTAISFDNSVLRLTWHQGLSTWVRAKDKDFQDEIEGDIYEFRAHRYQADRSVMRFELRLMIGLAAVFLQEEWNKETHLLALGEAREAVSKLLKFESLIPFNVGKAIKNLDQAALEAQDPLKSIRPHSTRLSGPGAYVEFASTSGSTGYQDFEDVRHVRRAVRPRKFKGDHGLFLFTRKGPRGAAKELRIQLYGSQRRIRLWAQMSAAEVWDILYNFKKYGS